MRVCLLSLIIFSYMFYFPLAKKNLIFGKSSVKTTEKIFYRVHAGDSLGSIAKKFRVTAENLGDWNALKDPDHLKKGQTLVIYKNSQASSLAIGETIILKKPVARWEILKSYIPYGDAKNLGLLCKISGDGFIKPATPGVIVKISQMRGYGKYILIDHGKGWHSLYSNLDHIEVKLGQHVDLPDIIGNAKNNKLFFLLAYNGKPVNPVGYFKR